jgi:hypothetical protein
MAGVYMNSWQYECNELQTNERGISEWVGEQCGGADETEIDDK